jgi:hypothetical protein
MTKTLGLSGGSKHNCHMVVTDYAGEEGVARSLDAARKNYLPVGLLGNWRVCAVGGERVQGGPLGRGRPPHLVS